MNTPDGTSHPSASQDLLSRLLRRVAGSRTLGFLRPVIRPLRPVAAAVRLVEPRIAAQEEDLNGWSPTQLAAWYARPEVSGAADLAALNARRLLKVTPLNAGVLLGAGDRLVEHRQLAAAIEVYLAAFAIDGAARYHFGQKFFDFLGAHSPSAAEALAITNLMALSGAIVPDLAKALTAALLGQPTYGTDPALPAAARRISTILDRGAVLDLGNNALGAGGHEVAMRAYALAMERDPHDVLTRLQMGVTEFLAGRYVEAERQFAIMDTTRRAEQARWGVADLPVTVMHPTWIQAVGHIACLDTYVKSMKLGWLPDQRSILAFDVRSPPIGWPLLKYWGRHIEVIGTTGDTGDVIDQRIFGRTNDLGGEDRARRRASMISTFWSGPDGQGRTRYYAPLGSAVQHAWRDTGHGPVLSVDEEERIRFRITLEQAFGLPRDAWFVLLHVREAGYKAHWETAHAYTRNADIETYDAAIQHIVDQGGWVVRGGDPSMRPIAPRKHVVDYATSVLRSPELDILLCAECRFFLGTNSGFSLVPPLFGRRCALTNWSPLGTPNWYPDDLFIPKLVRRRGTGELVGFEEMYASTAGWSQFQRDFTVDFEKVDNSAEDLLDATCEMLDILDGRRTTSAADQARLARFQEITLAGGGYLGSRLGHRFAERYEGLL